VLFVLFYCSSRIPHPTSAPRARRSTVLMHFPACAHLPEWLLCGIRSDHRHWHGAKGLGGPYAEDSSSAACRCPLGVSPVSESRSPSIEAAPAHYTATVNIYIYMNMKRDQLCGTVYYDCWWLSFCDMPRSHLMSPYLFLATSHKFNGYLK